ncbi:MAG: ThuA domain-containing protein [Halioglobus sp.]|nr:ThuA domain-containing protein [Halioglobus sp.]
MFRVFSAVVLLGIAVAVASLVVIWQVGAWHLVFPSQEHETVPPDIPSNLVSPAILLFTKTNAFRHKEGILGGVDAVEAIAADRGWGVFHTENGAIFNAEDLAQFKAVIFLNASGDILNIEQEDAFEHWLQSGGGWLGIHSAGDDSHLDWRWYRNNLIGADFTAHIMGPQFQTATVLLENPSHPVVANMPDVWEHEEEWYSWQNSPRDEGFTILATVDENSYAPVMKFMGQHQDLAMGDHPVVWSNCIGSGRSVYMTMGHKAKAFEHPQVHQLITNSLAWFMDSPNATCP